MFKILFIIDFLRTVHGGTENQMSYLFKGLPELGYSVTLISLQDSPFLQEEAKQLFPEITIYTLHVKSDITKSITAMANLFKLLRKERPDIVHTFFPASNSLGILIAKLTGVRVLISSRRDMGFNLTPMDILKLKIANVFLTGVIANSNAVKQRAVRMERLKSEKISVIYNGLDIALFDNQARPKDNKKECIVAIVANLNRDVKRVDLFVKACAIVHKEHPDVKYQVIGDGHLRESLEKLSSDLGLSSVMAFMGRRRDVDQLLEKVTVGVISSDSEGLSNAIMEYMAMGLPVVATDVGGNPELVQNGKTGFVVPPGDARAMAEAMIKLVRSPQTAQHMGRSGFEWIKNNFTIQTMIEKTDHFYRKSVRHGGMYDV